MFYNLFITPWTLCLAETHSDFVDCLFRVAGFFFDDEPF